jgi:hypothetical protein
MINWFNVIVIVVSTLMILSLFIIFERLLEFHKYKMFYDHIRSHYTSDPTVLPRCGICNKTLKEIMKEE